MAHSINSRRPSKEMVEALGQSEAFLGFQESVSRIAPINRPVLLVGERGTGKELAAVRLHYLSGRWQNPFVTLNCAALTPALIESELFGHERGAFTGATQQRAGRFEMADQGTFFLDEIGNIPLQVQEKILRVVEYGSFERVGSSKPVEVDVRIIAATNLDLSAQADQGHFMKDLLDRLSFEVLYLPPLRERKGDIELLAKHFAARMAFELGCKQIPEFTPVALDTLEAYNWPGNVRELKNTVERAVYQSKPPVIDRIIFNPFENPYAPTAPDKYESAKTAPEKIATDGILVRDALDRPFEEAIWDFKVQLLEAALRKARFKQKRAAQILGLTYHQFRALYRKYQEEQQR